MTSIVSNDYKNLLEVAKSSKTRYQSGQPFNHIVFDNFFEKSFLDDVLSEFPDLSEQKSIEYKNEYEAKLAGKGERFFGIKTKELMRFMNSERFLLFLQELTGIEETLIGDPYFEGAGQHEIKSGGFLKVHADFNKHKYLKLDRRLNVLVYLNKDWEESYGGHFELWDKSMENCVTKVLPIFNRVAIFSTTDFSYHGHPDPLMCPEDRSRKSLALYFYSNGRPASEVNKGLDDHNTLFQQRKNSELDQHAFEKVKRQEKLSQFGLRQWIPPAVITIAKRIIRK